MRRVRRDLWFRAMLVTRGMTLGVRVIAPNDRGEVLLVRHGYTPGWHLPGGGVDHGETLEEAARRELAEETGHAALGSMEFRGMTYNRRQWKGDHVGVFVAVELAHERDVTPGFEIAEIGFFGVEALPDATTPGTRARLAEWQAGHPVADHWS
ncbi:MAG: NUDIX domain-containing protein [Pseudomonadota bacterium]